jgi:hypothetical protein
MIAQYVIDDMPHDICQWFRAQIGRYPDYEDSHDEDDNEYWDDYINSVSWSDVEGGRDLWQRFYTASDSDEVINIYNSYVSSTPQVSNADDEKLLAEMAEKLLPYADTVRVVYEFAKSSGICATPESSIWINKFLCDTLISD